MSPLSGQVSRSNPVSPHRHPAVVTALVLGCAFSAVAFWLAHRWETEQTEQAFVRVTESIFASVERCFSHQVEVVRAVAGLHDAFPEQIGRAQYRSFVQPLIARCDAFVGVYSVVRVPAAERAAFEASVSRDSNGYSILEYGEDGRLVRARKRDEYFPIVYTEPSSETLYPRGFDLASLAPERRAVESVRSTGRARFVPYKADENRVLGVLFQPIGGSRDTSTAAKSPGANGMAGLVVGLSSLSRVVEEAFERAGNPPVSLEVEEILEDDRRWRIYSRASQGPTSDASASYLVPAAIAPREAQLTAEDYTLALRFIPDPGMFGQYRGWLPLGVMFAGLLFTGLIVAWLYRERRNTGHISALAQRLSEGDARKNRFLAVLGHELRNPLAPIANAAHVLRAESPPSPTTIQWAGGVIERQVAQLVRLVDDLLDLSRITRCAISLRDELVDMKEVVQQAVETVRPLIDARHHRLSEQLTCVPVAVRGDRARLVQILVNLLDNAVKYTPEGGRIEITLEREDDQAVLSVRDSGVGIAEENLPRLFELFSQIPGGDRNASGGGLGVGLGLSRYLVELQGGHIEATSAGLDAGSEFTVRLPVSSSPSQVTEPSPRVDQCARRILVIEDNEDVARSFAAVLETMGHEVAVAQDGPTGLAAAQSFVPDIAFIDIGLPGMDGYEVARRLRQAPVVPRLVALTGYGQSDDREQSRMAGFHQHLVKPAQIEALRQLLRDVPGRSARGEDRQEPAPTAAHTANRAQ